MIMIRLTKSDGSVVSDVQTTAAADGPGFFEVQSISFSTDQTLNITSATSGAGAGKITFNPFSFTMPSGALDSTMLTMQAGGAFFKTMEVQIVRPSSGAGPGTVAETFNMKLVAVKTISWSADAGGSTTQFTVEYGSLVIIAPNAAAASGAGGKTVVGGWNKVTNQQDLTPVTAVQHS
jgi:type VI secretion system (T6SS) effector Hcp